tara:strand:+ start:507 stop:776 length:270 start_codon:yes stop_codon:yes gene_type:complete
MRANNMMTELDKADVAKLILKTLSIGDMAAWFYDLVVEHEEEAVLMDWLENHQPDYVYADPEADAEDAADAAYESARDEGLFEDGRLWA